MRRILCALVTFLSLFVNFRASQAQTSPVAGGSVTSTAEGQGKSRGAHLVISDAAHRKLPNGTVIVEAGAVTNDIAVHDAPLLLEGDVHGDVLAVHSNVTIAPTAKVSGSVVVIDGSVDNKAGSAVRVVQQGRGVLAGLSTTLAVSTPAIGMMPSALPGHAQRDWLGGQLALLLFGLLCGFLAFVAAPRATDAIADRIALRPGASLLAGGVAVGALLVVNGAGALVMRSPARVFWSPFGAAIAFASLALLATGWVCGMRYAGEWVAKKLGRAQQSDSLYLRIAIGMGAFFFLNSFLGQIRPGIGVVGMGLEFAVAVMGIGSLLLTRFGSLSDAGRP